MGPLFEREPLARVPANLGADAVRVSNQRKLRDRARILEMVATGKPIDEILDALVLMLEAHQPGMRCGILIVANGGEHFRGGFGPALPEAYHRALDGVPITSPVAGPCGEATYRRTVIRMPDIAHDTRYAPEWHALMRDCGIRACRSTPVRGRDKQVLGAIAMYYGEPRDPDPADPEVVPMATHLAAIAIGHDRLVSTLRRNEQALQLANRAKDVFLAMLGHELRNPLAPIVTTLELMKRRAPDVFTKERETLEAQTGYLTDMVDDLLDVSRIVRGKLKLKLEPVCMTDVVAAATDTTAGMFAERRQALAVDVAPGLMVDGDARRLIQVVVNLLVNAAKFSPPGQPVSLKVTASGDWVRLSVRDHGIGMDAELLPHVFELFSQAEQPIDRSRGGLGMGLAIARHLVELHAGIIGATSDGRDRGSEFTVRLPLLALRDDTGGSLDDRGESTDAPKGRAALKVLIVDDHVAGATSLGQLLQEVGYTTRVEHDGVAALAALDAYAPAVVLIDIGLPDIDGYEVARRVRARPKFRNLPLIAVTGYGRDSDRAKARNAGFDGHIVKPVKITHVMGFIERLVESAKFG